MTYGLILIVNHFMDHRPRKDSSFVEIQITVQINHELISLLFSYMDAIEIMAPITLRRRVKTIAEIILKNNL